MRDSTNKADADRLAQLERDGIVSPPREPLPMDLLRVPLPRPERSVLEALLKEREGLDVSAS